MKRREVMKKGALLAAGSLLWEKGLWAMGGTPDPKLKHKADHFEAGTDQRHSRQHGSPPRRSG